MNDYEVASEPLAASKKYRSPSGGGLSVWRDSSVANQEHLYGVAVALGF